MNVTIKDLPKKLHLKLKARASANKRSLNWELIDILEKAVESTPVDVEQVLQEVARTRARIQQGPPLTDAILREAKEQNRR